MKQQKGASLIVALVLLTIITVVAVFALEGSNLQSKMVANSLFSTLTYQECRNEQEAQVRFYNINGGINRNSLLAFAGIEPTKDENGKVTESNITDEDTLTESNASHAPESDITITWNYIRLAPAARGGYDADIDSPIKNYLYENDCIATFNFSTNSQTQGNTVEGLKNAGNIK
ncbi:pilus assembly PilX family protein [Bermanella sp. WJH001]|uniref:pilus assembly PilX family protein n=1 Tax=Bermanella sp. WJH001 TaxID=3048005 RepID=UPI0024BECD5B|nr:pilus assembly PilX N-terminal domain-containing protein [Bermanella sp. WJH001]MDJ1537849.1 pilus assembly PilX N-terminal domain-containing protein [Bermanella sp. WJH001]